MMKKLMPLLACAAMLASLLAAQDKTILGLPSAMSEATRKAAYDAVVKIAADADEGDSLQVYDAKSGDRVCAMTFPKGNIRIRMRKLIAEFRALQAFLKRAESTRAADQEQIRVPQFLSTVGASLRQGSGKTQVVLYGRPAYADSRDPAFSWGDGVVPNDAYITAPSARSIFGTADRCGTLNEVVVHFCYVSDRFANELERRAAIRFWALYTKELGATLSTFELSPDVVLERVAAGSSDPLLPSAELDREVKDFVMVRYNRPDQGAPSAPSPQGEPGGEQADTPKQDRNATKEPEETPDPRIVALAGTDIVFAYDESPSNVAAAAEVEAKILERIRRAVPDARIAIVAHGKSVYRVTPLKQGPLGSEERHEGKSLCDPAWALSQALSRFDEASRARRRLVVLLGDQDCSESHGDNARRAEDRMMGAVEGFTTQGGQVVVIYTGATSGPRAFYEELAEAAGNTDLIVGADIEAILRAVSTSR